jgi:hypothetical protein
MMRFFSQIEEFTDYGAKLNRIIAEHKVRVRNREGFCGGGIDPVFYPLSKDGTALFELDGLGKSRPYVVAYCALLKDKRFPKGGDAFLDLQQYIKEQLLTTGDELDPKGKLLLKVINNNSPDEISVSQSPKYN